MEHVLLVPLLELVNSILGIFKLLVVVYVVLSWLVAFNVINTYNRGVFTFISILNRLVDPTLYHIRKFLPNLGGVDLSPIVMILLLTFLQSVITGMRLNLIT